MFQALADIREELRRIREILESSRKCRSCGTEHGTAFKCPDSYPELKRYNKDGTVYDGEMGKQDKTTVPSKAPVSETEIEKRYREWKAGYVSGRNL